MLNRLLYTSQFTILSCHLFNLIYMAQFGHLIRMRLLGETKAKIEQLLALTFENYTFPWRVASGTIEDLRPASVHAPALKPAVELYNLLHDIWTPEAKITFCHCFQVRQTQFFMTTIEFLIEYAFSVSLTTNIFSGCRWQEGYKVPVWYR